MEWYLWYAAVVTLVFIVAFAFFVKDNLTWKRCLQKRGNSYTVDYPIFSRKDATMALLLAVFWGPLVLILLAVLIFFRKYVFTPPLAHEQPQSAAPS